MIHPQALIAESAQIDEDVEIGPFSIIGEGVSIGAGTVIGPHVVIRGDTQIGRDNRIFQFASVGEDPQDKKYAGEQTRLEIGDRNTIREFATIHRGTVQDQGLTRIGNDNLFMAYIHVAHDCVIGDHAIMANAASLGGHVKIDDWAILGGFTMVHQFCHIGAHAFCAMGSAIGKDVPPYLMVGGHPARPHGINSEGLKRRGFDGEKLVRLKRAYKTVYHSGALLRDAIQTLETEPDTDPDLACFVEFLRTPGRGILR